MRLSLPKLAAIGLLLLLNTPSHAGLREDGAACDAKDSHPELAIPACTRLIAWSTAIRPRSRLLALGCRNSRTSERPITRMAWRHGWDSA